MKNKILGISPLLVFVLFYFGLSVVAGDFSKIPISVAFFVTIIYTICITRGLTLPDRVRIFGRGAGTTKMIFIICIFLVAGAFSQSAQAMGCIKESVDFILLVLPPNMIYVSIFVAGCFISMATGSGIGSIVAVGPIAVGVAQHTESSMPMMCALVVSSAMFGDNLSFISDTTIIATSTQGCQLKDKFRTNLWIVFIPALMTLGLYYYLGQDLVGNSFNGDVEYLKILPYIIVLILAISGVDVLITLMIGVITCGVLGLSLRAFDFYEWIDALGKGIDSMGGITLIVLMAVGLMALIKHNGGVNVIVAICTKFVRGRRTAESSICALTALMCACTANNTIAIMSVADIVKSISQKYGIAGRKAACLMDISSCIVQECLPYSIHLLMVADLASITSTSIIPYVFYVMILAVSLVICIIFNIPRIKIATETENK